MIPGANCEFEGDIPMPDRKLFLSLVGSLMYIGNLVRPDITYCVHWLARQSVAPSFRHFKLAKAVLGYLYHTRDKGLFMSQTPSTGEKGVQLLGYSDADYGNDLKEGKSTSGWVLKLDNTVVDFGSTKQKHVTRSSFEAEFISLSNIVEKTLFFSDLLDFLGIAQVRAPIVHCDNQATIAAFNSEEATKRSRYVRAAYHYTKSEYLNSNILLKFVDGKENPADVLTKVVAKNVFLKHVDNLVK